MAISSMASVNAKAEPRSSHVVDSTVQAFLQPTFDPADYLNTALPSLSLSTIPSRAARTVPLADVSTQLQSLLSQLNAQTSRLSNTLTQLTDEIIRSGSRLAYEVEVLRGETLGLTDALDDGLKQDIELLAPSSAVNKLENEDETTAPEAQDNVASTDPEFLSRLRVLTAVRERLDTVIKTFGSAMQWPVAPSEVSVASSLISVSAPELGEDGRSREDKAKQYVEELKNEVNALLSSGADGIDSAVVRVDGLRALAEVWKGTAEEKARSKFVETLQKLVDEKQSTLVRAGENRPRPGASPSRGYDLRYGNLSTTKPTTESVGGYGFLQNLRNLKNEVYID